MMKTKFVIILSPNSILNISINYYNTLLNDRDYLFKSELTIYFDNNNEIFAHIINCLITFVQTKNIIKAFIVLFRYIKLKTIIKYAMNDCY